MPAVPPSAEAALSFMQIQTVNLEYCWQGTDDGAMPVLVLLHEGLGSAALWGAFPDGLALATGARVFAWSRAGYGASDPIALPRSLDYMQREARDMLPAVLDFVGAREVVLIGHSDGASIAAYYGGICADPRVIGLVLIAPHFFCEPVCIAAIAQAQHAYRYTDFRERLARWHTHVDVAFDGWCNIWLEPAFASFDITPALAGIKVPLLIIQGGCDEYGSLAQIDAARTYCVSPPQVLMLDGIRHAPHKEAGGRTISAIARFVAECVEGAQDNDRAFHG